MAGDLKPEDLKKQYQDAKDFMRPLHDALNEYERVARNRPRPDLPDYAPKTTDGTLAAIVQDQPKRIIQQIPTGNYNIPSNQWLEIVAKHFLFKIFLKKDKREADPLQKYWGITQKSLTYGGQASLTQYGMVGGRFMAYTTMPYIKDILFIRGATTSGGSKVIFLCSWFTRSQIEEIIELASKDKENESGWVMEGLKKLKDSDEQRNKSNSTESTATEKEKNLQQAGIEIAFRFERKINSKIYAFDPTSGDLLRITTNKHPFGEIPINFLHANVDFSNPIGRGAVELSLGMQNFIDTVLQSYQYMAALLANPPLEVRGSGINKATIKFKNGAMWDLGINPDASVKPVQLDKFIVQNMPEIYGLAKSQILALNMNNDTSVGASSGNPGFSKTDAGVNALQVKLGISDNYMRKQFEDWFAREAENLFYAHFLNAQGTEEICLSDDDALRMLNADPSRLLDDGRSVLVDYDEIREIISGDNPAEVTFETSASSSAMEDTDKQVNTLKGLLEMLGTNNIAAQQFNAGEVIKRLVVKSGVEDPEKITDLSDQEQQGQMMQSADGQQQPMMPQQQQQPQFTEEEIQLGSMLLDRGVPEDLVRQAIVMARQGMPIDQILQVIVKAMQEAG